MADIVQKNNLVAHSQDAQARAISRSWGGTLTHLGLALVVSSAITGCEKKTCKPVLCVGVQCVSADTTDVETSTETTSSATTTTATNTTSTPTTSSATSDDSTQTPSLSEDDTTTSSTSTQTASDSSNPETSTPTTSSSQSETISDPTATLDDTTTPDDTATTMAPSPSEGRAIADDPSSGLLLINFYLPGGVKTDQLVDFRVETPCSCQRFRRAPVFGGKQDNPELDKAQEECEWQDPLEIPLLRPPGADCWLTVTANIENVHVKHSNQGSDDACRQLTCESVVRCEDEATPDETDSAAD